MVLHGGRVADRGERPLESGGVGSRAALSRLDALHLLPFQRVVDAKDLGVPAFVTLGEAVDADDDPAPRVDLALEIEGGVGDLAVRENPS